MREGEWLAEGYQLCLSGTVYDSLQEETRRKLYRAAIFRPLQSRLCMLAKSCCW